MFPTECVMLLYAVKCDEADLAAAAKAFKVYRCKSKEETRNWNASKLPVYKI